MDGEKQVGETQTIEYNENAKAEEVPTKAGYTVTWDNDGKNIQKDTDINAIYTANKYTVTIESGEEGNIQSESKEFVYDSNLLESLSEITPKAVKVPEAPAVEGKQFIGWKCVKSADEDTKGNIDYYPMDIKDGKISVPAGTILKAVYGEQIKVIYNDGDNTSTITAGNGAKIALPKAKGQKDKLFKTWNCGTKEMTGEFDEGSSVIVKDINNDKTVLIYAVYANKIAVTIQDKDRKTIKTVEAPEDGKLDLSDIKAPEVEGKEFTGWKVVSAETGNVTGNVLSGIKKGVIVKADYAERITLNVVDSVTGEAKNIKAEKGSEITLGNPEDRKDKGLSFKCWRDKSGKEYKVGDVISNIQNDITINPVYIYNFDITDTEGDKIASEEVEEGKTLTLPTVPTMKNGKEFRGWYVEGADKLPYDEKTKTYSISNITKDIKVIAQYGDTVTITAIDPVDNASKSYDVNVNGTVKLTAKDRTKEGLTLVGWRNSI